MRRLKRFIQLGGTERRILFRALLAVAWCRAALCFAPAETVRRWAPRLARGVAAKVGEVSVEQLMWAVEVASRYVPGATCLTQAIAGQSLLSGAGYPSQVEIGVAKDEIGVAKDDKLRLRAHAWVVCHGQVVLGGKQPEPYNSLMIWEPQK